MCTSSSSSLGDLLFHLCCVQSRAPRAMQMRALFSKTLPLSEFWQTAACLPFRLGSCALLQAWVVIRVACEELEWGCVLLLLLPATLLGPGVVLPSLCITDCESVMGMASQTVLAIMLGLADLPQARIISFPGNRQRHQGTTTDCEILGLGFLELLKKRKL